MAVTSPSALSKISVSSAVAVVSASVLFSSTGAVHEVINRHIVSKSIDKVDFFIKIPPSSIEYLSRCVIIILQKALPIDG